MLRITPSTSAAGAKEYFTQSLTRDDTGYYHEGQELAGQWGGKGAAALGLSGLVAQQDFFALCDNKNPENGEQLSPRNKDGRRVGFDFTFSAPKSVSVLYEFTWDERIVDAFRASFRETMSEMEPEMKTRVRKKGADYDRETGNMIFAEFTHFTARPVTEKKGQASIPDPHLHAHVYAFIITYDPQEGRYKAGQFGDLKRDATYWEASFDSRFAHRLQELGYATEKRGLSFEIAGTPQSLIDKFSRRRNEIERKAAEKGVTDAEGKHAIGYYGREHKNLSIGKEELRKQWNARLSDTERSALADVVGGRMTGDRRYTADEAKSFALEHSFQRASSVSEKRVRAEALKFGVGSVKPEDVANLAQHPEVISRQYDGQHFVTTKTVLKDEVEMLTFAQEGQRKFKPLVSDLESIKGTFKGLSAEQRKAALHPLTTTSQVSGIRGGAGTGKTYTLQTVNAVISAIENRSGEYNKVYAFAQSSGASRGELRNVGFKDADTLAALFNSEKMQAKLHRQVILVDEAGLLSSKDGRKLFDIAKKQESRVILVGDYRQHSGVEAGDFFRLIEKEGGIRYAQLKEIRRQTKAEYRKAVEQISNGTAAGARKGFESLDRMGWVVEASGDDRHRALVKDYLTATEENKSALIIAPTHAEGDKLTAEVRAELKKRGVLGSEHQFIGWKSTGFTDAQKKDIRNYEPGMVLEWHQNAKGGFKRGEKAVVGKDEKGLFLQKTDGSRALFPTQADRFDVYRTRELPIAEGDRIRITKNGETKVAGRAKGIRINNGDVFTVEGFTKDGDIRLEKGRLLPKDWGHLNLGYVDTSFASQGKTVDRVFIATGNASLPATNQQQWYVSVSRGREMAKVYVDSKEDVRNAIARTGQRLSAVELTQTKLRPSWREKFNQSLERNRVGRFLKQRALAISNYWRKQEGIRYA